MTTAIVAGFDRGTSHALRELAAVASELEGVFLDAGNGLGDAVERWRTIADTFAALAQQFDRDDMRHCMDDLGAALAVAATLGGGGDGDVLAQLGGLGGALAALRGRLTRLSRTIAEVKLVALNAKVEAAHLDHGSTDFSVFTREIDRLAADAANELAVLEGELRGLAEQTAEAHRAQAGFAEDHGNELMVVTRRLDEHLRRLSNQRHQVAEAATSIGARSRQAGDRVGQAVLALQIGDITRQRTEHVVEALEVLAGLMGGAAEGMSADDRAQAGALVASLQARQLTHTAGDLEQEAARVAASLTALADETEAIAQLGRASFGGDGERSFLEDLGREITHVEELLGGYAAARAHTGTTMTAVARAAAAMVAHVEAVHSIEADLKIMALNASFKCARLGDRGRTLSVVAQSLRQLANRTVEDAAVLMSGLREAMTTAEALARGQDGQDGDAIATAVGGLSKAASVLAATGVEQGAALEVLESDSRRAQSQLRAVVGGLAASEGFARRLRAVADDLGRNAAATPVAEDRVDYLKQVVLSRLSGNYTMASERALHDLFGDGEAATAPQPEETVDVDDLLF